MANLRWDSATGGAVKRRCWCEDGKERLAYQTAEPDTFFTTPARVVVYSRELHRNVTVTGFISYDSLTERWTFTANTFGKNHALLDGSKGVPDATV